MFRYTMIRAPHCNLDTRVIDSILITVNKYISIPQNGMINIVCVSEAEIQAFNKQYRKKDAVTDVLSFHYFESFRDLNDEEVAGEIIFCEQRVIEGGKEYGLGTEKEFYKLFIHSLLHILGYDHEEEQDYKKMQAQEEQIWSEVFEK